MKNDISKYVDGKKLLTCVVISFQTPILFDIEIK